MTDTCVYCSEPLLDTERRDRRYEPAHWECGLRSVIGGVNHLLKQCSCCGGSLDPDPDHMTRREASRVAAAVWLELERIKKSKQETT